MSILDIFKRKSPTEPANPPVAVTPEPTPEPTYGVPESLRRLPDQVVEYVVKPGDTLSLIAKRYYGDAGAYMRIFEANRDILKDPNLIHPGNVLKIPNPTS